MTKNKQRFNKFKSYFSSQESNKMVDQNLVTNSFQPELVKSEGLEKWVAEVTDEFSLQTAQLKQEVPYFNVTTYFLQWLLSKWKYLLLALVFLTFPLIGTTLLTMIENLPVLNWLAAMLKQSLEYQPVKGISIFSGLFYIFLIVESIIFVAKEVVSFPHKLQEHIENNRLVAKQSLQQRQRDWQAERFKEYQLKLDDWKQKQELIYQAQQILTNQISLDKQSRIILAERLGEHSLPVEDKYLSELVLKSLAECYSPKRGRDSKKA